MNYPFASQVEFRVSLETHMRLQALSQQGVADLCQVSARTVWAWCNLAKVAPCEREGILLVLAWAASRRDKKIPRQFRQRDKKLAKGRTVSEKGVRERRKRVSSSDSAKP